MSQFKRSRRFIRAKLIPLFDLLLSPLVMLSAYILYRVRKTGVHKLPLCKRVLFHVGVFPIRDHYYEPLFNSRHLKRPLQDLRELPGLDLNTDEQLQLLSHFTFSDELKDVPRRKPLDLQYYFENGAFGPGDADYFYNLIRHIKPKRLIEIGSGKSTLLAIMAINKNLASDINYSCRHICIEPYASPWLEQTNTEVIRKKAEDIDPDFYTQLQENDILFIDSSHIIRPQGDVLFEYLQLLPALAQGVIVHIHDIFTPHDYPDDWVIDKVSFWNEQYLLEAFLSNNSEWKIIGALNYLYRHHDNEFMRACPYAISEKPPRSFYVQKK